MQPIKASTVWAAAYAVKFIERARDYHPEDWPTQVAPEACSFANHAVAALRLSGEELFDRDD